MQPIASIFATLVFAILLTVLGAPLNSALGAQINPALSFHVDHQRNPLALSFLAP